MSMIDMTTDDLRKKIVACATKHGIDPDHMFTIAEKRHWRALLTIAALADLGIRPIECHPEEVS